MLISEEYRQLNEAMFEKSPSYGTSGSKWALPVHRIAIAHAVREVLDYGCGQGTLREALVKRMRDYAIYEYDPAIPGKQEKPIRADMVVCGDVLEHIEPEYLHNVLDDIRNIARVCVFLVVATAPAVKHLPDGRNTHLIVEPLEWWMPKLRDRWKSATFSDFGNGFSFLGKTV